MDRVAATSLFVEAQKPASSAMDGDGKAPGCEYPGYVGNLRKLALDSNTASRERMISRKYKIEI